MAQEVQNQNLIECQHQPLPCEVFEPLIINSNSHSSKPKSIETLREMVNENVMVVADLKKFKEDAISVFEEQEAEIVELRTKLAQSEDLATHLDEELSNFEDMESKYEGLKLIFNDVT